MQPIVMCAAKIRKNASADKRKQFFLKDLILHFQYNRISYLKTANYINFRTGVFVNPKNIF
jgi:hypothetical protein